MRARAWFAAAGATLLGAAPPPAARPAITGISHLAVYSRDLAASERFYTHVLGARPATEPDDPGARRFLFSGTQYVEVLPAPAGLGASVLAHVAYTTTDAAALRDWLATHGQAGLTPLKADPDGARWFGTHDPEGNEVRFVQPGPHVAATAEPGAISGRIIHVGYMAHDRAKEDGFYRRLLGFHPYWYGAMRPDAVDWVSQQTPDGRDWLEYMLVGPGTTTPLTKLDARELGVLNHFSLGVANMEAAVGTLYREGRLPLHADTPRHDGPSIGLDGKWQANVYDPDGTRIELMEFQPTAAPCCSSFTADSPRG